MDTAVTFNSDWHYVPTSSKGYVGLVDPSFSNELAFLWDKSQTHDFMWKPRADNAGTYSLFIGANGGSYGTINADSFSYRFVLKEAASPSNGDTQPMLDYAITNPPSITSGGEESQAADTTAPTVTITSPTNTSYENGSISLEFSASEAVEWCGYSLNGEADVTIPNCSNTTLSSLATNSYTLMVKARDYAGNTGSSSVNFTVIGDITPPTVSISAPTHTTYSTFSVPLTFTASEPVDLCSYSLNGGSTVTLPGCSNTTITLPANGAYNLTVYARDLSGNTGSASILFGVSVSANSWWDTAWHYRIPVTISTGTYSRKNEPVELDVNFTTLLTALGESGLSLDPNSIRVLEYSCFGQLDRRGGFTV